MRPVRNGKGRGASWLTQVMGLARGRDAMPPPLHAVSVCGAWGVELDRRALHLVRVSGIRDDAGRVSGMAVDVVRHIALPPSLVDGSDIVAPDELGAILREALAAHMAPDAAAPLSMALCPSVVLTQDIAWTALLPGYTVSCPPSAAVTDALGPWIRWHARRISGLDDADLLVDWRVSSHDPAMLTLTVAQAHYLLVRDVVAEHAGARLQSVVDAGESALRACRFVIAHCVLPGGEATADAGDDALLSDDAGAHCVADASASASASAEAPHALAGDVAEAGCTAQRHEAEDASPAALRIACVWCGDAAARAWTFAADRPDSVASPCALPDMDTVSAEAWLAALRTVMHQPSQRPALVIVCGHDAALAAIGGMSALSLSCPCPVTRFNAIAGRRGDDAGGDAAMSDCAVALGAALHGLIGGAIS